MALIDKIKSKIKGRCAFGLHMDFTDERKIECHLLKLKRIKNSLSYVSPGSLSFEEFLNLDIPKLPVVLCFTGSNVIIKKVEKADTDAMLLNLIPQGRSDEFFYDFSPAEKGYKWLSVIRKDDVKKVIEILKSKNMFLAGLCIGPFDVLPLISGIEGCENNIKSGRYRLELTGEGDLDIGGINDFTIDKKEENIYIIGGEEISSKYLPAYAAAVSFFIGKKTIGLDDEVESYIQDYNYSRRFKALYCILGLLLFVMLIANFLVFSSYRNKYEQLRCDVQINKKMLIRLDSLKADVKRYKGAISRNYIDENSNMSILCDRLIMKMPEGIKLRSLSVCPMVSKKREGKPLKYKDGIIHIEGVCKDPKCIDYWLRFLKDEDWLESVVRQEYFESEGQGVFILELKILSKKTGNGRI